MHIHLKHTFHKSLILPRPNTNYNLNQLIPKEWQLILVSDGSFTQTLTSLTGKSIELKILAQYNQKLINNMREVWLEDYNHNKLAFAKSSWYSSINSTKNIKLLKYKPIGQSLSELKTDIYKDIDEIYYGYSSYLENKFNSRGPIWGRKYTIYYQKTRLTTIQEIFSPEIIKYFTK